MKAEMALEFEKLFNELKKETINEMNLADKSFANEKGDDVDLSLEERERSLNLKLLGRNAFLLKKIDTALAKIKNGNFGICDECGGEIELNRLKARPVATQCISCKEEEERNENQMLYEKRSHTHGRGIVSNVISIKTHNNHADRFDRAIGEGF